MHAAELVLDCRDRRRLALGGGALVAGQSAAVVAEKRTQVAHSLVYAGDIRITQGECRLEVRERIGVSVQRRGVLRSETVVLGRAQVISGQTQVLSDERRAPIGWPPPRQRGGDAPVEQAAPRHAGPLVGALAELLVREVVGGVRSWNLTHQALPDELLER